MLPHWLSSYARDVVSFEKKKSFFGARYLSFADFFTSTANDLTGQQKKIQLLHSIDGEKIRWAISLA